jgi:hypothetical protein
MDNKQLSWRPGSFVTAEIMIEEHQVQLQLPRAALQTMEGKRVAFVRTPEGFASREIKIGKANDEAVEITAGLSVLIVISCLSEETLEEQVHSASRSLVRSCNGDRSSVVRARGIAIGIPKLTAAK